MSFVIELFFADTSYQFFNYYLFKKIVAYLFGENILYNSTVSNLESKFFQWLKSSRQFVKKTNFLKQITISEDYWLQNIFKIEMDSV